jgi:hypothetical protein
MDRRIALLRHVGVDVLAIEPTLPTILVVNEEFAGLLAALEVSDNVRKPADRLRPKVLAHLGRILREGAKVRVFAFTIIQRPDAAIIGGADRAQYARRITHRLDNGDGVRMLNEGAEHDTIDRLQLAKPGVGLLNEAGEPLRVFRSAYLTYPQYVADVRQHYRPRPIIDTEG